MGNAMAGTGAAGDCRDHSAKRGSHRVHAVYNTFIPRGPTRENGNENADIGFRAGDGGSNSAAAAAASREGKHVDNYIHELIRLQIREAERLYLVARALDEIAIKGDPSGDAEGK